LRRSSENVSSLNWDTTSELFAEKKKKVWLQSGLNNLMCRILISALYLFYSYVRNIKYLEKYGKVVLLNSLTWLKAFIFVKVFLCYVELFCFHSFALNRCHILEMWQIHVSEVAVLQLNSSKGSVVDWRAMVGWHNQMLLHLILLIKQLVNTKKSLYSWHMHQMLFFALYANQLWPLFSHLSKGTTVPKLVSLATVETVELQLIIDQSLGLRIFFYLPSFHVVLSSLR
jgi:hypothetical protein